MRGALVDIHAVFLVLGYTIQGWVGFGFYFWKNGGANTWRPPIAIQCFWPLCLLIGLPFMPESPRWLCLQGREAEAEAVLIKLHATRNDPDHDVAKAEFYQIKKQIAIDRTLGSSWIYMFKKPSYRKRAFLAMGTTAIIQCSGVLVINNYGPTLYAQLGFTTVKQLLYPAAWLTFALGLNAMAMLVVDRFSRPKFIACKSTPSYLNLCPLLELSMLTTATPNSRSVRLHGISHCGSRTGSQLRALGQYERPPSRCRHVLRLSSLLRHLSRRNPILVSR